MSTTTVPLRNQQQSPAVQSAARTVRSSEPNPASSAAQSAQKAQSDGGPTQDIALRDAWISASRSDNQAQADLERAERELKIARDRKSETATRLATAKAQFSEWVESVRY